MSMGQKLQFFVNVKDVNALLMFIINTYSGLTFFLFNNGFQVSLPSFSLGLPAYYVLASSESSSNLSRYDGIR